MGVEEEKERRRWERSQALTEQFQQDLTSYRQTGHVQSGCCGGVMGGSGRGGGEGQCSHTVLILFWLLLL